MGEEKKQESGSSNKTFSNKPNYKGAALRAVLVGAVKELGDYVYKLGDKQGNRYVEITEAIADYVGNKYGIEMADLCHGRDVAPVEPTEPTTDKEDDPVGWFKYEKRFDQYIREETAYKKNKSQTYSCIWGQCSHTIRCKLEQDTELVQIRQDADVIKLLEKIMELMYQTATIQYPYWVLSGALRKLLTYKQKGKSLSEHHREWDTLISIVENKWGPLTPTKLEANADANEERKKFLACLFLYTVNWNIYGEAIEEMNNQYISENKDAYPPTVADAVNRLAHRMKINKDQRVPNKNKKNNKDADDDDDNEGEDNTDSSYAQAQGPGSVFQPHTKATKQICNNCGGKGHGADKCPSDKQDKYNANWSSFQYYE
jgi:hypothetical protein